MLNDLRVAWRYATRAPLASLCAVAILALPIGANATLFGLADAILFRPLPYADPDQVFVLRMTRRLAGTRPVDSSRVPLEYVQALASHHRGIAAVGLRSTQSLGARIGTETAWVQSIAVTPGYFAALGARPLYGRLFAHEDAAHPGRTAVLTYDCWRRHFGGDPAVVGRAVRLGSESRVVIGVLQRGFIFPAVFVDTPYGSAGRPDYVIVEREPVPGTRTRSAVVTGGSTTDPIVRLRPGVRRGQAQAELDALIAPMLTPVDRTATAFVTLRDVRSVVFPTGRGVMTSLLVAAVLVVLVACANMAGLLSAEYRRRERELAIRVAMGATRAQLLRPLLIEAVLIGAGGGVVGLLLAHVAFDRLLAYVPTATYGTAVVGIDARAAAFTFALGLAAGLLSSLSPALRVGRADAGRLARVRYDRASRSRRGLLGQPFVAGQVALTTVLVFGAAVSARALLSIVALPLGFDAHDVIVIHARPPGDVGEATRSFYRDALAALARHPEVLRVGAATAIPLDHRGAESDADEFVRIDRVLPGFLEAIGVAPVRGRLPDWADVRAGRNVTVVTESAARVLFPGQDPVGCRLRPKQGPEATIVGVVANVRKRIDATVWPMAFALPGNEPGGMVLVARVRHRYGQTLDALRREVVRLSPDQPVTAAWWSDSIDAMVPFRSPRLQSIVLGAFGGLSVALTALGLFALVSVVVTTCTREIGVRLALGASPGGVVGWTARQALLPVVVGAVGGLSATVWLRTLIGALLFGVDTDSLVPLATVVVVVVLAGSVAAYLPARRAGRVQPNVVLRVE